MWRRCIQNNSQVKKTHYLKRLIFSLLGIFCVGAKRKHSAPISQKINVFFFEKKKNDHAWSLAHEYDDSHSILLSKYKTQPT